MNRRQWLVSAAGAAVAGPAAAPARASPAPAAMPAARDTAVAARALRHDLGWLDRLYRELHPGLLRYQSPAEWRDAVKALDTAWAERAEHRLDAAFVDLGRLLARVRCGHSYANFYNQRREVAQALFAGHDKLPLTFVWLGERMIVKGGALPAGTEVRAIDGTPAPLVLARLLPLVRGDGHNDAKRRALLSVDARAGFESFDIFHALSTAPRDGFVLDVREPGGRARRVELPAIDLAGRRAMNPRGVVPPSDASPPWSLRRDPAGHAVLTMPGWALYDSRWNWAGWLDRRLDEVVEDRTRRLIVDLRQNEGGLDCGDPILARCIDRPLPVRSEERLVRYRRVADELNPMLDTWDDRFRDWGERAVPAPEHPGFLRLVPGGASAETGGAVIEPRTPRFTGELLVLTSSTNSSATFRFASLVREHRLGRLVGATTGGNQRGINGGAFFFVRLPETGLEVDLPLIGYFPPGPLRPDARLEPDLPVADTIDDIATGRDRVLEAAARA